MFKYGVNVTSSLISLGGGVGRIKMYPPNN